MLFDFANILIFLSVAIGFVLVSLTLSSLLRPHVPLREKLMTYECGEIPTEGGRIRFNMRFYIFALVFIIFDVEIALMFPVGAVFKQWVQEGNGLLALLEIAVFVLILLLGLIYVWVKGDLEWAIALVKEEKPDFSRLVKEASKI